MERRAGFLIICVLVLIVSAATAQERRYFRIVSSGDTHITEIGADGYITWTNESASGVCTVETATVLGDSTEWRSYVRIPVTSEVTRTRLFDFDAPEGMAFIPEGENSGTNPLVLYYEQHADGTYPETYSLKVDAFYIGRKEVTNDEVVDVFQWAIDRSPSLIYFSDDIPRNAEGDDKPLLAMKEEDCRITWDGTRFGMKGSKGSGYPCVWISWYGAAAYCNYLSLREGLELYYNMSNWSVNPSANGYRLPTSDEWEYAARGGVASRRFPWGDNLVSHEQANYQASHVADSAYDESYPAGYHPDWYVGDLPYTSPVGSFAPFGYGAGLYDMCGNVWEWCDDWHSDYVGLYRVIRSGSWAGRSRFCLVGYRSKREPLSGFNSIGFRTCLPPTPGESEGTRIGQHAVKRRARFRRGRQSGNAYDH